MTSYIVTFSRILMLAIKMCSRNLSFIIKGKNKSFSSIHIVKLRQGSGKDWQGMVTKRHLMAPNGLKPLPRAYIKVGCHLPPPPEVSLLLTNGLMLAR